jgi:hypothetical protein
MLTGQGFTYEHFTRLFGFGRKDANRLRIHMALCFDAKKMRFMYPRSKSGSCWTTTDLLPFYAYMNHIFRNMMIPREGDSSNVASYNKNILAAMVNNSNGFKFCVFDFIWEEIKAISEIPLKSYGYAPYIMHMIESDRPHLRI